MSSDSNQPPVPPVGMRTTLPIDVTSEFRALLKDTVAVARDSAHAITDAGRVIDRSNELLEDAGTLLERANKSLEDTAKVLSATKPILDACSRVIRDLSDETRRKNDLEIERQKNEALVRAQRESDLKYTAERQTRLQTFVLDVGEKVCNILDSRWSTIAVIIGWMVTMIWWFVGDQATPPPLPSPVSVPLPLPSPPSESP